MQKKSLLIRFVMSFTAVLVLTVVVLYIIIELSVFDGLEKEVVNTNISKLTAVKNNVENIVDMNYIEDTLDGDQIQTIITNRGKIVVKNIYMVGAVWVESEVELNAIKI